MAATEGLSPADVWAGVGWRNPVRPVPATGSMTLLSGAELIRQSIGTILDTEPGERVMLPGFGCGLRRYLMAPNTTSVRASIQAEVTQALGLWEPRVRVTQVTVTPDPDATLLWIDIAYVRLVDLRPDNLVYPFYLR